MKKTKPKILFYDIETKPVKAWIWNTGKQFLGHEKIVKGEKFDIITICYKFLGKKSIHSLNWGLKKQNSGPMIKKFSKILEQADVCLAHNGDRFDLRQINTQRLLHKQGPVSWPTPDDTLKQLRKHFYLPSYRLDYVAKLLTGSGKDRMNFQDWIDIVENKDPKALKKMISYCKKDVLKLEQVWSQIRVFCKPKVNLSLITRGSCPNCGGNDIMKNGFRYRYAGKYQRFVCRSCGHKFISSKRLS